MNSPNVSPSIKQELTDYFSSMLRVPPHQIATDVHILELGVDSIMLIEAQRWLKTRFDCSIEVNRFFEELNTIERIAAFVGVSRIAGTTIDAEAPPQHVAPLRQDAIAAAGPRNQYGLLRAQLALVGEVIEAQNRLLTTTRRAGARADDASV